MRSAISWSPPNMPTVISIPWTTNVKVTASVASNPPIVGRASHTASST
jgi:hypothetical protein